MDNPGETSSSVVSHRIQIFTETFHFWCDSSKGLGLILFWVLALSKILVFPFDVEMFWFMKMSLYNR